MKENIMKSGIKENKYKVFYMIQTYVYIIKFKQLYFAIIIGSKSYILLS